MGKDYNVELLGSLPLDIAIREQADSGKPTVVADPDGRVAADLPADRAPGGGQDRREGPGPLGGVPQDRHSEHLTGADTCAPPRSARVRAVALAPLNARTDSNDC